MRCLHSFDVCCVVIRENVKESSKDEETYSHLVRKILQGVELHPNGVGRIMMQNLSVLARAAMRNPF